jgi:prophage regulatory protein
MPSENVTLLRLPNVLERTGLSRSKVYELIGRHQFPKPVRLGARFTAWVSSEIDAWVCERVAQRDATGVAA